MWYSIILLSGGANAITEFLDAKIIKDLIEHQVDLKTEEITTRGWDKTTYSDWLVTQLVSFNFSNFSIKTQAITDDADEPRSYLQNTR